MSGAVYPQGRGPLVATPADRIPAPAGGHA
jgi:hypothetical protein